MFSVLEVRLRLSYLSKRMEPVSGQVLTGNGSPDYHAKALPCHNRHHMLKNLLWVTCARSFTSIISNHDRWAADVRIITLFYM